PHPAPTPPSHTLSLHDALPIYDLHTRGIRPHLRIHPSPRVAQIPWEVLAPDPGLRLLDIADLSLLAPAGVVHTPSRTARAWSTEDRKSTRLNSSHVKISYAVFC